jgi:hypothetical protein
MESYTLSNIKVISQILQEHTQTQKIYLTSFSEENDAITCSCNIWSL